jgi:hypothetical protein
MTGPELRTQIERLTALDEVRDVVLRYGRAVDRCDWALAHSCYHDDAVDEHGIFNGDGHQFVDFLAELVPDWTQHSQHAATNSLVRLAGEVAFAETYHIGYHRVCGELANERIDMPIAARAVDRLQRRDGSWRLSHRVLVVDWSRRDAVQARFQAPAQAILGRRDKLDPSYAAFQPAEGPMHNAAPATEMTLEEQVALLIAKEEIREVIARFARGVDRLDWELQRSCYHDDAHDHHGVYDGPIDGFIEFGKQWLPEWTESTTHSVMNCLIQVDGETAAAETYVIGYHRGTFPETGVLSDLIVAGRYVDRFERRDGRWLIADRTFVFDWSRVDPVGEIYEPPQGGAVGSRDRADPSYTALPQR